MATPDRRSRTANKATVAETDDNQAAFTGAPTAMVLAPMMADLHMNAWRRAMAMQAQTAEFAMKRMERNMATWSSLTACKSPADVMAVCTDAMQTAAHDFAETAKAAAQVDVDKT